MVKLFTSFFIKVCSAVIVITSLTFFAAHAQNYSLTASSGTFTPITGIAADAVEGDEVISGVIPVGFDFTYYGTLYPNAQIKASSNGFITFNTSASDNSSNSIEATTSTLKSIAPLWDDLDGAGGQASYTTTGVAGSRVFTFEWLNSKWDWLATSSGISFQVKLYEGTNAIEFIYRQEAGALNSADASIGLIGNAAGQFYSLANTSAAPTLSISGNNLLNAKPATNQVYKFTPSAAAVAPTVQALNITTPVVNKNDITVNWTSGNGAYRAVFVKQTSAIESFTAVNGQFYEADDNFGGSLVGSGWNCVYNGTGTGVTVFNLLAGFPYRIQVVEYNGLGGGQKYLTTGATNNPLNATALLAAPTGIRTTAEVSWVSGTKARITVSDGDGDKMAIFMKATTTGTAPVVDNATYAGNFAFGTGNQIGTSGWYCVYNGAGVSTLDVTGLSGATDYRLHVVDYNGPVGSEKYTATVVTDNPVQVKTFTNIPVLTYNFAPSTTTFTPIAGATNIDEIESDDALSNAFVPIGFTFRVGGIPMTQFTASSNGVLSFNPYIKNNNTSAATNALSSGDSRPAIAPLWDDLDGTGGQASYVTTGSAPNRVFTIEFLNWQWNYSAPGAVVSFQVKLYETINKIEFVYRQDATAPNSAGASIGLAFADFGSGNFLSLNNAGASPTISSTSETSSIAVRPATGQVYSFTPVKFNQTITFGPITDKLMGSGTFELTATSTSGLPVTYASSNTAVATVSGNIVTLVGVGSVTITASHAGDENYNAATSVPQTFAVKSAQTITFDALTAKTFGDAAFNLAATASSSLAVTYTSSNTAVATISGNTVTIVGGGTTDITASQIGNATFVAAVPVIRTLTVNKANQTITFGALATKTLGDAAFTATATSTSGLTPVITTTSDKVTISGSQVTLVKAGSVTIKAEQPGNASFNAATAVEQTFCINPAKPTVTTTGLDTEAPVLTSSIASGNQWYKDGVIIDGATNTTFTAAQVGIYAVKATADACVGAISDNVVLVITGTELTSNDVVQIYPNPVANELIIDITSMNLKAPATISLLDVSGREIESLQSSGKARFNVSAYKTGNYLLYIRSHKQTITRQIIKK